GLDARAVDRPETWLIDNGYSTAAKALTRGEMRPRGIAAGRGEFNAGTAGGADAEDLVTQRPAGVSRQKQGSAPARGRAHPAAFTGRLGAYAPEQRIAGAGEPDRNGPWCSPCGSRASKPPVRSCRSPGSLPTPPASAAAGSAGRIPIHEPGCTGGCMRGR